MKTTGDQFEEKRIKKEKARKKDEAIFISLMKQQLKEKQTDALPVVSHEQEAGEDKMSSAAEGLGFYLSLADTDTPNRERWMLEFKDAVAQWLKESVWRCDECGWAGVVLEYLPALETMEPLAAFGANDFTYCPECAESA